MTVIFLAKTEVYNPWSVTSYLNGIIADKIEYPRPYWANTSSNGIIRELIENAGGGCQGGAGRFDVTKVDCETDS